MYEVSVTTSASVACECLESERRCRDGVAMGDRSVTISDDRHTSDHRIGSVQVQ